MKTKAEIESFARELNALLNKHGLNITQAVGPALWLVEATDTADFRLLGRSGIEGAWIIAEPWEG